MLNITITEAASKRLQEIAEGGVIRLDIKSTGCSGYSYDLTRAAVQNPGDDSVAVGDATIVIDKTKSWMMIGMTIDYQETDFAQEFVFLNPNEKGRCGCGESFAI